METLAAIATGVSLGLVVGLAIILAWSIVGLMVAVFAYYTQPSRGTPAGACGTCSAIQALWDGMNLFEKIAAAPDFALAKLVCNFQSCPIDLD